MNDLHEKNTLRIVTADPFCGTGLMKTGAALLVSTGLISIMIQGFYMEPIAATLRGLHGKFNGIATIVLALFLLLYAFARLLRYQREFVEIGPSGISACWRVHPFQKSSGFIIPLAQKLLLPRFDCFYCSWEDIDDVDFGLASMLVNYHSEMEVNFREEIPLSQIGFLQREILKEKVLTIIGGQDVVSDF